MATDTDVIVKLKLDSSSYTRDLDKATSTTAEKLKNGLGKAASVAGKAIAAGVAVGTAAVGALSKSVVDSYADWEQLVGGVDTLFKDASVKMGEYASVAYETAGLSENEYMETVTSFSASLIQGLAGDTEKAADIANQAVIDMSDNANKMGTDMSLIQNAYQGFAKQNYMMLDNLKLGYGGTATEMARLVNDSGVLGDAIKVDAKTINSVSFDKIIEAIHVVQDRIGITGTTANEAAETVSGSVNMMKKSWANLVTYMGNSEVDVTDVMLGDFVKTVKTTLKNVFPVFENALYSIVAIVKELAPVISAELPKLLDTLLPAVIEVLTALITGLVQALPELLPVLLNAVIQIVQALTQMLPAIIPAVVEAITQLVIALIPMLPDIIMMVLPVLISSVGTLIKALFPALVKMVVAVFENLFPTIGAVVGGVFTGIGEMFSTLAEGIGLDLGKIGEFFGNVFGGIATFVGGVFEAIATAFGAVAKSIAGVAEWLGGIFKAVFQTAYNIIVGIFSGIGNFFSTVFGAVANLFRGVGQAIGDAVGGSFKAVVNTIIGFVEGFVNIPVDAINGLISIINAVPGVWVNYLPRMSFPRLATGGIVPDTPGGRLILAGEGGQDEWVVPESKMASLIEQINDRLGDGGQNITINVSGTFATSPEERRRVADQIVEALEQNNKRRFATV